METTTKFTPGPMTHVVKYGRSQWPGHACDGGILVDLRLFERGAERPEPPMVFDPERLATSGVPAEIIAQASESNPQGFVLVGGA